MQSPLTDDDPRQIGPFTITARLGSGAMGRVYLGRTGADTAAAVKLVRAELADDPEFRRRFRQEVEAVRLVSGPHTATLIGADTEADKPWLATEYLPGVSLQDEVRLRGPLPVDEVLALARGIAAALAAIHAAGVVHRDLKPGNVILLPDGPRVIDFGIARAADVTTLTATGITIGTPSYLAPEQVSGAEAGPTTDVFALGALLTYVATGHTPFGDGPTSTILYRIAHDAPKLAGLPEPLRDLVAACLAKEPSARPTPAELVARTGSAEPTVVTDPTAPAVASAMTSSGPQPARPAPGGPPTPTPAPAPVLTPTPTPAPAPTSRRRAVLMAPALVLVAVAAAVFVPLSVDNKVTGSPTSTPPGCQGTENLDIAGTPLAADVIARITNSYSAACPGKTARYSPSGGGDAITQFNEGDVAMAVVDGPYYEYEFEPPETDCDVRLALLSARPIAVMFQIEGVDELTLDASTVAKIFAGTITDWRDPAISEQNPRTALPILPITVVHREDASNVTALFQKYLAATGGWTHGTKDTFTGPEGRFARGDEGVRKLVAETEGAITYTVPGPDRIPAVRVGGVPPTREAVAAAVAAAISPATLEIQPSRLFRTAASNAYGLAALSYAFTCADNSAARGFVMAGLDAAAEAPYALPTGEWADRLRAGFE